jgi:hypothetical protein
VAKGKVVKAVDKYPDLKPGVKNPDYTLDDAPSNHVIVEIGGGRYAIYAHLVPGNVTVEEGDLVVARIREGWSAYRGRSVEPLVRESIFRILPDERFGDAQYVGGYWTRKGDVEVDLIGAEKKVRPRRFAFVRSIKWREKTPFGGRDLGRIAAQREEVPGTDEDTFMIGVSRGGFDKQGSGLDTALVPEGLLEAWKR